VLSVSSVVAYIKKFTTEDTEASHTEKKTPTAEPEGPVPKVVLDSQSDIAEPEGSVPKVIF
jgi:hypothetical protein